MKDTIINCPDNTMRNIATAEAITRAFGVPRTNICINTENVGVIAVPMLLINGTFYSGPQSLVEDKFSGPEWAGILHSTQHVTSDATKTNRLTPDTEAHAQNIFIKGMKLKRRIDTLYGVKTFIVLPVNLAFAPQATHALTATDKDVVLMYNVWEPPSLQELQAKQYEDCGERFTVAVIQMTQSSLKHDYTHTINMIVNRQHLTHV